MELKTKNKNIILVFTTRKIVNISNVLKGKNFEELYFKALNESDLNALSKIIFAFAETEEGVKAFNHSEEVYEFIDEYKTENQKTYDDIFKEIAEAVNEEGFFKMKMSKEELTSKMSDPLSGIDMNKMLKDVTEKVAVKVIEKEAAIPQA